MIASSPKCDPGVSVVIPCLDRIPLLRRALESVFSQTCLPNQVIVVDDGSSPPLSNSFRHEFPKVEWLWQKNAGVSSARNHGIRKASFQLIAFLDSDDEWNSKKLEKQLAFHQSKPELLASHTEEIWIRNGNQVMPPRHMQKSGESFFERSLERCLICPSSVLLEKSLLKSSGYFDETLPVCEDYDLWLRILTSEKFGLLEEALVIKYGGHPDQLSRKTWGMDRYRVRSLEKLLGFADLDDASREKVLSVLIKKCKVLSIGFANHEKFLQADKYQEKAIKFEKSLEMITENQAK